MRVIISGALGHMGRVLLQQIQSDPEHFTVTGGLDIREDPSFPAPIFTDINHVNVPFDVLIDFSVPNAAMQALSLCLREKKPCVIATTGLSDEQVVSIQNASADIPVFYTGNMSVGVNLQLALIKKAASVLGDSFDMEIVETHHNLKKDAPSGTALMIANALKEASCSEKEFVFGRNGNNCKRQSKEIGIHSLRGGTIVGEHTVRFLGIDEEISVTHKAYSKAVFAKGALRAAQFIEKKNNGLYDMNDLLR